MKLQKGSLLILSIALFFTLGLLPIQAAFSDFVAPTFAYASEAEPPVSEDGSEEPATEDAGSSEAVVNEEGELEPMPEYIDDTGEGFEGIEAISGELDDALEGEEEADAVVDLNEPAELGIVPLIIVIAALIASGVAAFFIATKKPKQPTVQ